MIMQKKRLQMPTNIEVLEDTLRKQIHEAPLTPHWAYMARLSYLFRQYLSAKFKFTNPPTGGSGEVFFKETFDQIPEDMTPDDLVPQIKNIFHISSVQLII